MVDVIDAAPLLPQRNATNMPVNEVSAAHSRSNARDGMTAQNPALPGQERVSPAEAGPKQGVPGQTDQ
jgi:hypothetical protein